MSEPYDADVVIAGAGVAGATLALALKSGGLEPVLVDPAPFDAQLAPSFDGRSWATAYSCFRQWRTLGLADDLEPHAQRMDHILVTDGRSPGAATPGQTPFFLHFDAAEIADRVAGEPLGYMLESRHVRAAVARAVLDAGIRNTANEPARPSTATGSHFGTGVRNAISRFSSHFRHGSDQPPRLFFHRGKDGR
jgi:2-octaprenyl-6-methoxyphenol hydroxylase